MKRIFSILFALVLVLSFSLIPATLVGANSYPGLVGLWHLDEGTGDNASDSSGNANHGTIIGASWEIPGKFGNALSFDGTDDYVQAGRTGMDKTQGTFELWVKPLDLALKPQAFMVVNTTAGIPHNYQIQYWTDGRLYFRANKAGQEVSVLASSVGFTQDNWHHLAMTWDSSGVVAYVDGNSVGSYTGTMTFTNDLVGNLFVGAWFDTGRNSKAVIDEVRIWDEALTAQQIEQSYLLGTNTTGVTVLKHKNLSGGGVAIFTSAFHVGRSPSFSFMVNARAMIVGSSVTVTSLTERGVTPRGETVSWGSTDAEDSYDTLIGYDITVDSKSDRAKSLHLTMGLDTDDGLGVNVQFLPYD